MKRIFFIITVVCITLMAYAGAPERAEVILARSWDYCNSRVIVGAHWQSDVDNSRTAASVGYGALQGSDRFRSQVLEAQCEYQVRKRK